MAAFEEILKEIDAIPAIDIHSHIKASSPAAQSLTDIAYYHYIRTELKSAGVPADKIDIDNPSDADILPRLERITNTTTYWCLSRILRDLYDSPPLHEADLASLRGKIIKTASDDCWTETVLDRANVSKVFITADWSSGIPKKSDRLVPTLRVDSLVNEMHISKNLDRLNEVSGLTVFEAGDAKKAIWAIFAKAAEAGVAGVSASFNPQVDFDEGDREGADRILSLVLLGQRPNREDRKTLRSWMMRCVLEQCAEYGMPFQLMIGVKRPVANNYAISAFDPAMVTGYAEMFARHSNVRFDVFTSNETIAHELVVVARNFRNVFLSGYWWYLMFPSHIRKLIRERIEMLPMSKSCGFFSDAYCVEWVYGKSRLVRRELAFVLAQMIEEGYLTQETALAVARHYLLENPKRMYGVE